ncbi:UNVERIFIED_CONTAM: hypothetical protein GTU68_003464 [Idotea baltica]|nr:hypothetical protein [Idotea baltica]
MVGSSILRQLRAEGYTELITATKAEVDLREAQQVEAFMEREQPEYIFLAAAKVGGILANHTYPADFILDNLLIETNVIRQAHRIGVKKLLFLGSSCIYPKHAPQPLKEDSLLTGPLEPTNRAYALAKIAGIELCQSFRDQYGDNFIACMPTNLYGPNDNYDLENSHVLPAMVRKFYEASQGGGSVQLWGDGSPKREFLYVDDLADACLYLMRHYDEREIINVGTGEDLPLKELAERIATATGFEGEVEWDISKPNGTPRKWLDVSRIHQLGWQHQTSLASGIEKTLAAYVQEHTNQ